jgi:eukaryotic-like serine/threonine-protein kinase
MIIDGQAAFRTLLMHHVSTHWPDASITEFDPTTNGHLPDSFSGAGNDLILLGDNLGDRDGIEVLERFSAASGFPPRIYFSGDADRVRKQALEAGAGGVVDRNNVRHNALIVMMGDLLRSRQRVASTSSLFVGDLRTGINPLIKGYRLQRRLSASQHSGVYLARRDNSDQDVVLKVLRHDPDRDDGLGAFDRFLQEYELIADMKHPNIVRIFDLGVSDDHAHIAMEYLAGGDLKARIAKGLPVALAVDYARQIASALARIHKVGILHRDLKPGNIMLREDSSLALIDFGLAKHMRLQQEITDSGEIFGTPYYMSPEQGRGNDVDHRSDIYSLGIIFYEMLTGLKPYRAANAMGIIFKHTEEPIPLLPARLAEFQAVLNLLLAKKPDDRLQSAAEFDQWL